MRLEVLDYVEDDDRAIKQLCHYCKRPLLRRRKDMVGDELGRSATKDHMDPKALGGSNDKNNLIYACARDNGLKGHIPYKAFKTFANMVLIPYPDLPTPVLRNSLTIYIMHLVEIAVSNNKAMRDSCSMALLSLVDDIKAFENGKRRKK